MPAGCALFYSVFRAILGWLPPVDTLVYLVHFSYPTPHFRCLLPLAPSFVRSPASILFSVAVTACFVLM